MSVGVRTRIAALVASVAIAGTTACTHAPDRADGYGTREPRSIPDVEDVPVRGFKVRIRFDDGERLTGELLVAEADGVVVVRTRKAGDQTRETSAVERAMIQTDPDAAAWLGGIGGVTAILIPVSLATGWYLVYLMPIIVVGGSIAMGIVWAESRVVLTEDELAFLYQYARWPQGRPVAAPSD